MIDIHCHILPGVDDGAASLDAACRMAALAAESGVGTLIATPHCNARDERKNYRSPALDGAFAALQREFDRLGLPVRVLPGCEVLLRGDVGALLAEKPLYTLAASRYLLVEFYFDEDPRYMDAALATVRAHGYAPFVAHPERYFCVQDDPALALRWFEAGCGLQLNKGSVLGDLGEGAYDVSRALLRDGLCHAIASDAHHFAYRTPSFARLLDELDYAFPAIDAALLLERNPQNVLQNRALEALS